MSVKRSFRLTRGGWALLVLGALMALGAFNASLNITYLLASLLLALFGASVIVPLWDVGGLRCRRSLPRPAFAGEPFEVRLHLHSSRRTAAHQIMVREPLCSVEEQEAPDKLVLRVRPGEHADFTCTAPARRRGAYETPGVAWASSFPFGTAESRAWNGALEEVLVFPARGRLMPMAATALKPRGAREGSPSRLGLPGEDFRTVREYKPGDNPRWIHWRATARHGTLCVREMERERSAPVLVVLDARIPAELPAERRERAAEALELAVAFAAELCRMAHADGNRVALAAFFPRPASVQIDGLDIPAEDSGVERVASSPGALLDFAPAPLLPLYEALARLQPSQEATAEGLREAALAAGLDSAWRIVAVTPTRETAQGLASLLSGTPAHVYVADEPGFADVFTLTAGRGAFE